MAKRKGTGDGGVRKRTDGRWEGSIDLGNGNGNGKFVYGYTRAEAPAKLRRAQLTLAQGRSLLDDRTRVSEFLDQWLAEIVKPRRSYGHWRNCESNIRLHIKPAIGRLRLAKLSAADVGGLINATRATDVADDTVRLVHATLRAALTTAKRWGLVYENVATLVEPITIHRDEVQPFSEDEVGRLLASARGDRLEAFATVALALGIRPGEARALAWEDIDLEGPVPSLRVARSSGYRRHHARAGPSCSPPSA